MNPAFMRILDDTQDFLKYTFGTENNLTLAISGTGHGGMEAGVANIVERGDTVIVGTNGIWGERMADLADRFGATVVRWLPRNSNIELTPTSPRHLRRPLSPAVSISYASFS